MTDTCCCDAQLQPHDRLANVCPPSEPPCLYAHNCCHACEVCWRGCRYDEWASATEASRG